MKTENRGGRGEIVEFHSSKAFSFHVWAEGPNYSEEMRSHRMSSIFLSAFVALCAIAFQNIAMRTSAVWEVQSALARVTFFWIIQHAMRIMLCSRNAMRKKSYELFYFTHHRSAILHLKFGFFMKGSSKISKRFYSLSSVWIEIEIKKVDESQQMKMMMMMSIWSALYSSDSSS